MGDNLATRNGADVHSLAGGVQALWCGQLRQASQTRTPAPLSGNPEPTAGVPFSSGMLGIPGMAVHSAQRSLTGPGPGELSALDADAGVRTERPIEKAVGKPVPGRPRNPSIRSGGFPRRVPNALRPGRSYGWSAGGVAGSIAGPMVAFWRATTCGRSEALWGWWPGVGRLRLGTNWGAARAALATRLRRLSLPQPALVGGATGRLLMTQSSRARRRSPLARSWAARILWMLRRARGVCTTMRTVSPWVFKSRRIIP